MNYRSIKNPAIQRSFVRALREGLAPDRSLFVPEQIPSLEWESLKGCTLSELAALMMKPLIGDAIERDELEGLLREALNFEIPTVEVHEDLSLLELFHGPTSAFKDVGARVMSRLLGSTSQERLTVLVATSGDTGSAVAQGFFQVPGIDVVILYPSKRISKIQEQQLTTVGENVVAIELEGTFDDCQALVKEAFLDESVQIARPLTSANSINVGRWLPQSIYYAWATLEAGEPLDFVVPSGNFGNIAAGVLAQRMGMPVGSFCAAVNANDVMKTYMQTGLYQPSVSIPTISNAMDVGDPSNRSRIEWLYNGAFDEMKSAFHVESVSEASTLQEMTSFWESTQQLVCPHTAVGIHAARQLKGKRKKVVLSTAHPAKFGDVVKRATGQVATVPEQLKGCIEKEKVSILMPNDYSVFRDYLLDSRKAR